MPGRSVALLFFSAILHKHPLEELLTLAEGLLCSPNLSSFLIIVTFSPLTQKGCFFTWWFPKKTQTPNPLHSLKIAPEETMMLRVPRDGPMRGDGGRELRCFPWPWLPNEQANGD